MTLQDELRAACDVGRQAAADVAQRNVTVKIVTETWTAPLGTSTSTLSSTSVRTLTPKPRCRPGSPTSDYFTGGIVADSTGALSAYDWEVGPITTSWPGGGYTMPQLAPAPTGVTQRVYVVLQGEPFANNLQGGEPFEVLAIKYISSQSWVMAVRRAAVIP